MLYNQSVGGGCSVTTAKPTRTPCAVSRASCKRVSYTVNSLFRNDCRHRKLLVHAPVPTPGYNSLSPFVASAVSPVEVTQAQTQAVDVDVDAYTVGRNVTLIRSSYKYRLKYEVEYNLRKGTSDNSYLLTFPAEGQAVLVDVPYEIYTKDFMGCLENLIEPSALTHLVLTHLDPKCLPTLEVLLRAATKGRPEGSRRLQLMLSNPALKLLETTLSDKEGGAELLSKVHTNVIKASGAVSLGDGTSSWSRLEMMLTPTPRWPDHMAVYDPQSQLMFTGKFFSCHVAQESHATDVGGWEKYEEDWRYFYECMLAPSAAQVALALDRLDVTVAKAASDAAATDSQDSISIWNVFGSIADKLKSLASVGSSQSMASLSSMEDMAQRVVSSIAPMHGPVVKQALSQLLVEYHMWTEAQIKAATTTSITVMYASAYGNTAALAQAISHGMTKAGVAVKTLNLELASLDEVSKAVNETDGFIIGSPTLGGHMPTQVQIALGAIIREPKAKALPCGVFGSFGWSGEAVDEMEGKLRDAGFKFAFDSIRVKFKPTSKDLQQCEQSGRDLAVEVKKKSKSKLASVAATTGLKVGAANGPTLAIGRLVGSLCIVTARDEDASCAMLASWVTQASFDPPGLTVAVKKDRAMEQLLVTGAKFSMSLIPEGEDKVLVKALSKPFTPLQDRLAGIPTKVSEVTGAAIVTSCCAALDCQVSSRMEAGDHWILYATVLGGKMLNDKSLTAVHHRKVGNHY